MNNEVINEICKYLSDKAMDFERKAEILRVKLNTNWNREDCNERIRVCKKADAYRNIINILLEHISNERNAN